MNIQEELQYWRNQFEEVNKIFPELNKNILEINRRMRRIENATSYYGIRYYFDIDSNGNVCIYGKRSALERILEALKASWMICGFRIWKYIGYIKIAISDNRPIPARIKETM